MLKLDICLHNSNLHIEPVSMEQSYFGRDFMLKGKRYQRISAYIMPIAGNDLVLKQKLIFRL